jgi:hypothetical protein
MAVVMMPAAMPAVIPTTMPAVMAVPVMMMPAVPVMMMVPPPHFGRRLLRIRLNGCGRTRIAQRQGLRLPSWSREHKTCANRRKAQNFRCVHINPPSMTDHVSAARLVLDRFVATQA